ncbi:hypothetical protein OJ997_23545 [Solirubrobacter phytolaccae]|uniref:Uncharacterized protein n=1 Tax=Solirubrobacter phytolaccae TaxID=1404360 RepID=A0A9X3SB67_9ACTN|nr:hypothetical protein [Solirubrobacter phytolaccae]MDA0183306.1 hypothetical protein [Solirubrobacter phytolaccae]
MPFRPPPLDPDSQLLRTSVADDYFQVTEYMADGAYPSHRVEKDEAEAYVATVVGAITAGHAERLADDLEPYLRAMFPPEELSRGHADVVVGARQVAFAALQRALDGAWQALIDRSFDLPSPADPTFAEYPTLWERVTKDGLVRLEPADVVDEALLGEAAFAYGNAAIYPHPLLAPARELVDTLLELARQEELTVALAVHPFRITDTDSVPARLLEDYWYGIKIDAGNLDSLDPHDVGVRTFHAARQDTVERLFDPLLGTWFDWERRSRHDGADRVKRLYIREVRPAADRHGEPLVAAANRELHAERDTAARRFTHVDGKLCEYDATTYEPTGARPDAPLGVPTRSRKLWRVDGPMSDHTWGTLVGLHFRQNELIQEHLDVVLSDGAD